MRNSSKHSDGVWSTILTLAGVVAGVFLITKLTHQETCKAPMSKESDPEFKTRESKPEPQMDGGNSRQERILSVVKEKGMITPRELQSLLPDVSTRTLRRDMDALAKAKLVSQKGSTKSTFYKYTGR